jgi:hypothetical protein
MRVRIRRVPLEREVDGVSLGSLLPGAVREFSSSIGSWLIAEGYAEPEMRAPEIRHSSYDSSPFDDPTRPRRRQSDR